MLEANKSAWFKKIFAVYNRNLLKRRFHSFQVSDVNVLREQKPQIIYLNHSSWWDGLIAFELFRYFSDDNFVMMEERHLKRLVLFRRLGAFSVVRENPRQAIESINYAVNLLKEKPERAVWIFPQGEILPNDSRPLHFFRGLARIAEKVGDCSVVPGAIRYEFLGDFKPEVFVKIGEPEHFNKSDDFESKRLTANFERQLTKTLDELKRDIISGDTSRYRKIF
ncbi:MAG: lysophospholipid acyltransferase family protein [Pyrinomonadaceae bacterium]|nr:lysophospholipid acyltransferase family protein [Pyrinomonadaceae bacterium]